MGTRNTKNNLVISYPSQILCLIFLCLYELNRRIVRMCELIDVKMTLTFCLLFVVKRMVIVVFFNEILNSSTHLLTYNYKIDVENKKKWCKMIRIVLLMLCVRLYG